MILLSASTNNIFILINTSFKKIQAYANIIKLLALRWAIINILAALSFQSTAYSDSPICSGVESYQVRYSEITIKRAEPILYRNSNGNYIKSQSESFDLVLKYDTKQSEELYNFLSKYKSCNVDIMEGESLIWSSSVANAFPLIYLGDYSRSNLIILTDEVLKNQNLQKDLKSGEMDIYLKIK